MSIFLFISSDDRNRLLEFSVSELDSFDEDIEEDYGDDYGIVEDECSEDDLIDESIKKKIVFRMGKKVKIKRSNKEGFTIRDGKEVKMKSSERRKRKRAQIRAARKRKSKFHVSERKRKITMKKRDSQNAPSYNNKGNKIRIKRNIIRIKSY